MYSRDFELLLLLPGTMRRCQLCLALCAFFSYEGEGFVRMGTGNTRRSAKRLKKQLSRTDRKMMRRGSIVEMPSAFQGGSATTVSKTPEKPTLESSFFEMSMINVSIVSPNTALIGFTNGSECFVNTTMLHQRRDMDIWLATRRCLQVTASEFAAVLGKSPFTKRKDLLEAKLGLRTPFQGNAATKWGLRVEPLAVKQYAEATGNTVYETGLWVSQNDVRFGASPDGLVFDPHGHGTSESNLISNESDDGSGGAPDSRFPQGILEVYV